jgi:tetrahydromethanopterin S-methyltransferase subunit G
MVLRLSKESNVAVMWERLEPFVVGELQGAVGKMAARDVGVRERQ